MSAVAEIIALIEGAAVGVSTIRVAKATGRNRLVIAGGARRVARIDRTAVGVGTTLLIAGATRNI
jgi:hypothetical protein